MFDGLSNWSGYGRTGRTYSYSPGCHHSETRYWKTDQNVTLGLFHFIGPADSHTHTYIHHPCTVALTGLADWSFPELLCQPCEVMAGTIGPMKDTRWEMWV